MDFIDTVGDDRSNRDTQQRNGGEQERRMRRWMMEHVTTARLKWRRREEA